jgi:hypothetical protein
VAVLDLPAPEGLVTPVGAPELRRSLEPGGQSFSSPEVRAASSGATRHETTNLADALETSERALSTARTMLERHVAGSGEGTAGPLTVTLDGFRRASVAALGLMVGRHTDQGVGVALVADPLVLLAVSAERQVLHWTLLPGGPTVTSRADGLRLIRGLAAGGQLTLEFEGREPLPPVELDGGDWRDEEEWRLFEDLAVLEEWSGTTIPMPGHVSAEEATVAAQAASWVRSQQIEAQISEAITFGAATNSPLQEADELRLHQDFAVTFLGVEVFLGEGVARVELARVEKAGPGRYRGLAARPDVSFSLVPPSGRRLPSRRTQPASAPVPPSSLDRSSPHVFERPARRRLSDVLSDRRAGASAARHPRGTAGLLDEVRGE